MIVTGYSRVSGSPIVAERDPARGVVQSSGSGAHELGNSAYGASSGAHGASSGVLPPSSGVQSAGNGVQAAGSAIHAKGVVELATDGISRGAGKAVSSSSSSSSTSRGGSVSTSSRSHSWSSNDRYDNSGQEFVTKKPAPEYAENTGSDGHINAVGNRHDNSFSNIQYSEETDDRGRNIYSNNIERLNKNRDEVNNIINRVTNDRNIRGREFRVDDSNFVNRGNVSPDNYERGVNMDNIKVNQNINLSSRGHSSSSSGSSHAPPGSSGSSHAPPGSIHILPSALTCPSPNGSFRHPTVSSLH